eukprot:CAMPEP_0202732426 /NCGR_PEP_ID=MMETSP1385-20130828/187652_1 /ASSEMBLY_ACC=CAM_ASM_000861 /TAXON_ID=933848 /ORGANISM="Elphidium margaritaceum" /LENGTH=362 /DNA_ID=CAMNT_0049398737 /DNA_START=1078 /DNA_END=2163 /DNA_ORIENTATION=-
MHQYSQYGGDSEVLEDTANLIRDDDDEQLMIAEYESDIPDFFTMIAMKYYGVELESTEFHLLSVLLIGVFLCDLFLIGFVFNVWRLFESEPNLHFYLLALCVMSLTMPLICSYLFGKTFKYLCCRKDNYKLSIVLEKDKLIIKALLSRWFVLTQALLYGYLWYTFAVEMVVFTYVGDDQKYATLVYGISLLVIYVVIAIFMIGFKLNKKLMYLLWTMHNDDESDGGGEHGDEYGGVEAGYYHFYASPHTMTRHSSLKRSGLSSNANGVGNLGLSASVRDYQFKKKKIGRRMVSHWTQKAKQATHKLIVVSPSLQSIESEPPQQMVLINAAEKQKGKDEEDETDEDMRENIGGMVDADNVSMM